MVDIAEDVSTYLATLHHPTSKVSQSSLDANVHKNLVNLFTKSADNTARSIKAIADYLLGDEVVKKESGIRSLLASTRDAGSFLKGVAIKISSLSSSRDQARKSRHELAGAFKFVAYALALGPKYEEVNQMIHKYCFVRAASSAVQSLVQLHSVLPFSSGGPQLESSSIIDEKDANRIASINTSDGINHLTLAMIPEGNRWLSDCSSGLTTESTIENQGKLATIFWTSLVEQARKIQNQDNEPAFRNFEATLRRSVTRLTNPSLRVAVIGVVKAGYPLYDICPDAC
jgi:hypothetical protein